MGFLFFHVGFDKLICYAIALPINRFRLPLTPLNFGGIWPVIEVKERTPGAFYIENIIDFKVQRMGQEKDICQKRDWVQAFTGGIQGRLWEYAMKPLGITCNELGLADRWWRTDTETMEPACNLQVNVYRRELNLGWKTEGGLCVLSALVRDSI